MSQKGNPALIGFFVIGAVVVLAAVVVALGNITFNDEQSNCVLYFQGSLHGLSEGAPVTYRGVKIGQVTDIAIAFDPKARDYQTPVYIAINRENLGRPPGGRSADKAMEKIFLQDMIKKGLRAKLEMQSLVTGQLYIDFDFYPETEARYGNSKGAYLEIPTLPSKMEQLTSALANLELESLINRAVDALDNLNSFLTSEGTRAVVSNASQTFQHLDNLIVNADRSLPRLVEDVRKMAGDLNLLTGQLRQTLEEGRKEFAPVAVDLKNTLARMERAAADFSRASENVSRMTARDSRLLYELNSSLHEVAGAAKSVRSLADLLQRNPDVLLFGPGNREGK